MNWAPAIFPDSAEEALKQAFFRSEPPGFFVDVGANHPREASQTWNLEQRGWTGVLVEPQPDLADVLRREQRAKVHAVACSSPANAGKTLPLYLAGIQTSLDPNFCVANMKRAGLVEVPIMTLDDILADAGAPTPIDFMSIDVEDHELEVLSGIDLARWRPRPLLIEDLVKNRRLHRTLQSRGYKWIRRTGINGWYVLEDSPIEVGLFGRVQFFRKYDLGVPFRNLREAKRRFMGQ